MKYYLPEIYFSSPPPKKQRQNQIVLNHLQTKGNLTQLLAVKLYNIYRLGARVYDLKRDGHPIKTRLISEGSVHYAEYSITTNCYVENK